MKSSPRLLFPYLALITGVLALSLSSLFIRWAHAPGPVTTFYRMLTAVVVFLALFLRQPRENRRLNIHWIFLPILGGLFTAMDHATWATAIQSTRVANATLLNNMAPIWVALVAALLWREHLPARFWLGLFLAVGGAAVVLGGDMLFRPQFNSGNLLALTSSFFYGGYFLITQRGREHFSALNYVFLITATCCAALLVYNLAAGNPLSGFDAQTWWVFLAAGLVSQVVGYFSTAYALGQLPAALVSPSMIAQPVLTALLAIPLAGEALYPAQWLGGLVVLAGIYLVNRSASRPASGN